MSKRPVKRTLGGMLVIPAAPPTPPTARPRRRPSATSTRPPGTWTPTADAPPASGTPRPATRGRAAIHPDQEAAAAQIVDALGAALGADVRVRPRGTGFKAEVAFASADEALALARRLRPRAVA